MFQGLDIERNAAFCTRNGELLWTTRDLKAWFNGRKLHAAIALHRFCSEHHTSSHVNGCSPGAVVHLNFGKQPFAYKGLTRALNPPMMALTK